MAADLRSLLETLDEALAAYKRRIAELEATVSTQQQIINELRTPSEKAASEPQ